MPAAGPVIVGLPAHLADVPPGPNGPDDPERDVRRADWRAWREQVIAYRNERHRLCATDPQQQELERKKCKRSRAYFLAIWGTLHEPRPRKRKNKDEGQPPFIPFAKQVELLDLLEIALTTDDGEKQDLVVSKCRDVGATWVLCNAACHDLLFEEASIVGMVSYKEEYADGPSKATLLGKVRHTFDNLPPWMGASAKDQHRKFLHINSRVNENEIFADSTTPNFGVAARGTWCLMDEFAKHQHGQAAWGGSTDAFGSRVAVSTESFQYGTFHRDLWTGKNPNAGMPLVLEIDWWDNPMLDDSWFEERKRRDANDPAKFAMEVLRNPYAGPEVFVYPEAREAVPDAEFDYVAGYPIYVAIDPGVRDDFAFAVVQDRIDLGLKCVIDGYNLNGKPADYYASILSGKLDLDRWDYDEEAIRLGMFFATATPRRFYGDVYGGNREGATMDSVYDRLAMEPYGIIVMRDRMPDGKIAQSRRVARSYGGRRQALHELFPRLRFGTTTGAHRVLNALQGNRYKPVTSGSQNEERKPLHDDTSHYTSAMEYLAVNWSLETELALKVRRAEKPANLRYRHRQQLTLQPRQVRRWTA